MKFNLRLLGALLLTMVILAACKDEEDHVLKLSGTSCAFGNEAGNMQIAVGTNIENWKASSSDTEWLTTTPSGDFLSVNVTDNDGSVRSGIITVYAGEATATINVVQEGRQEAITNAPAVKITPEPEDDVIPLLAGPYRTSFTVTSDDDWNIKAGGNWFSVNADKRTGIVTINYELNEGAARTAEITITAGEGETQYTRTLTLEQIARDEDPYYSLMGEWEMYCSEWVLATEEIGSGSYDVSTFSPGEPYETITVDGMFFAPTSMLIYYDHHTGKISIPVGWPIHETESAYVYLLQFKTITKGRGRMDHYYETITGEISAARDRIELTGFHEETFYLLNNEAVVDAETLAELDGDNPEYQVAEVIPTVFGMGLMGVNKLTSELSYYSNVYYANTGDIVLSKVAGSGYPAPASAPRHSAGNKGGPMEFTRYGSGYIREAILK